MPKFFKSHSRGFTLLEILLVVGIIAILAGVVIVAINPSRQLKSVRDVERKSDIGEINKAMVQFYIDKGYYPASSTLDAALVPIEVCNTSNISPFTSDCEDYIDLSELVPVYLTAIPRDPSYPETAAGTGYKVSKNNPPRVYVEATYTELSGVGDFVAYVGVPPVGYTPGAVGSGGGNSGTSTPAATYTVTFDTQGGSASSTTSGINSGATISLPSAPTRSGYTFDGWYTQINGGGTQFTSGTAVVASITVYAKWVEEIVDDGSFRLFTNGDFEDGQTGWSSLSGPIGPFYSSGGYGDNGGYMVIQDSSYISPSEDLIPPGISECAGITGYVRMKARAGESISGQIYRRFNENPFEGVGGAQTFAFTENVWRDIQFFFEIQSWTDSDPIEFWFVANGIDLSVDNIGWEFQCSN